jgi:hypothetical protein
MPTLYGFSNDDLDFYLIAGAARSDVSTWGFNTQVVKSVIYIQNTNQESHRLYLTDQNWGGAARSGIRYQFQHYTEGGQSSFSFGTGATGQWIRFWDVAGGREVFRIANASAGGGSDLCQLQYASGSTSTPTWIGVGVSQSVPSGISTHTITIKIHATQGILQWHMNGALIASISGSNTIFTPSTTIDMIGHWCWAGMGASGKYTNVWTEHILASEDFMTYGLRVTNPALTGSGTFNTQFTGSYTDVNERVLNTATAVSFTSASQTFTAILEDVNATFQNSPIMGVRVSSMMRRGATGPQTFKPAIAISGSLYTGSALTINGIGYSAVAYMYLTSPSSSTAWSFAEVNAMEVGGQAGP